MIKIIFQTKHQLRTVQVTLDKGADLIASLLINNTKILKVEMQGR